MFMGQGVEKNVEGRGGEAEGRVGEDEDKQVKGSKILGISFYKQPFKDNRYLRKI